MVFSLLPLLCVLINADGKKGSHGPREQKIPRTQHLFSALQGSHIEVSQINEDQAILLVMCPFTALSHAICSFCNNI